MGNGVYGLIPPSEMDSPGGRAVRISPTDLAEVVRSAALRAGFRQVHFQSRKSDGSFTGKRRTDLVKLRSVGEVTLLVRWKAISTAETAIEWAAGVQYGGGALFADVEGRSTFEHWFKGELREALARPRELPPAVNPVVRPGQVPPLAYSGQLYDYSALATADQVRSCRSGTLPIGHEAFGWPDSPDHPTSHGDPLFLPLQNGRPREELGVLVCAPQGTGKTYLLLEWAAAAIRMKRSVFLLDVKGNLRDKIEATLVRKGLTAQIDIFSTDVNEVSGQINLFAGIDASQADCVEELMLLAEAMMPATKASSEDDALWKRIAIRNLRAVMQIVKLLEFYDELPGGRRVADLTDVYRITESDAELVMWIVHLRRIETWRTNQGKPLASYSVDDCLRTLAIALAKQDVTVTIDGVETTISFTDGQRAADRTYLEYMIDIFTALEPFRPSGFMAARSRSGGDAEIRLDEFGRDGVSRIVILNAGEANSRLATTVVQFAWRRLRQSLDKRRTLPSAELGDVLLLLDETSRIPDFDPIEFVSFVRENKVGYAIVYQGLKMVAPADPKLKETIQDLLTNIGTQIYLGGLSGYLLDAVNENYGGHDLDRLLPSEQHSPSSGTSRGSSLQSREVTFLRANAAKQFPAGRYPALVVLRGGPPPFLSDLDTEILTPSHGSSS